MPEWYHEFIDLNHKPTEDELLCLFRVEPAPGFTIEDAAGRVASESSVGTWTELTTMKARIRRLMAKACEIQGNLVKISYPAPLFEPGNMAQVLSSIAGNIFGMKAVQNVRLEDIRWPRKLMRSFQGPLLGSGDQENSRCQAKAIDGDSAETQGWSHCEGACESRI